MKLWFPTDPDQAGVYMIELDGVIRYVGETHSIRERLRDHGMMPSLLKPPQTVFKGLRFAFSNIFFTQILHRLQRLELERRLIVEHNPSLNQRSRPVSAQFKKFIEIVGSQAQAAKLLEISPSQISMMAAGKRKISPAIARRVEIATQGQVTKESLVFGGRGA